MNIITSRFNGKTNRSVVERALNDFDIGYYGCISDRPEALLPLHAREREFFDTRQMKWGHYSCDWREIAPLDESIIQSMRECEAVSLEMMSRLEERRYLRYEDRKRLYLIHLRYWNDLLDKKKIDTYLPIGMPHEMPDYVLYCLCRAKGIRVIYFLQCPIRDTLFLLEEEMEETSVSLREKLQSLPKDGDIILADHLEEYFHRQVSDPDPKAWESARHIPTPQERWWNTVYDVFNKDPILFFRQIFLFFSRRVKWSFWLEAVERHQKHKRVKEALQFYKTNAHDPDFSQKYIYIPLHVQPECSTCPMGGVFVNQEIMVALIAACIPDDVFLYVKEHPNQCVQYPDGRCRSVAFYRELLREKNVRFISQDSNTFALIENALAVTTVTGTAGFEALFRGKPVIMFGHRPYQYAPGVFRIHSLKDCREAMQAILQGGAGPTLKDMRRFLKAMEEVTIHGYFGAPPEFDVPSEMPIEEIIRNLSDALRAKFH